MSKPVYDKKTTLNISIFAEKGKFFTYTIISICCNCYIFCVIFCYYISWVYNILLTYIFHREIIGQKYLNSKLVIKLK